MCVTSMIMDDWTKRNPWVLPSIPSQPFPYNPQPISPTFPNHSEIGRTEFELLRAEVAELKKLLTAAKEYDEKTNQRDCEQAEKINLIKNIAKLVGINFDDVFPSNEKQNGAQ